MQTKDNLDDVLDNTMKNLENGMKKAMYALEADVKQVCPVKTGTLKRSYTSGVDVDKNNYIVTGYVGTNVEYAVFADAKRPHLSLMAKKNQGKTKAIIENELKGGN